MGTTARRKGTWLAGVLLCAALGALLALSACTSTGTPYTAPAPAGPDFQATIWAGAQAKVNADNPGPGDLAALNIYAQATAQAAQAQAIDIAWQVALATANAQATDTAYNRAIRATTDALTIAQAQGAATSTAQAAALVYAQTATAAAWQAQATQSAATAQAEQTRGAAVLAAQAQGTAQAKQARDDARAEQQAASAAIGAGLLSLAVPVLGATGAFALLTLSWHAARLYLSNVEEQRRALALRARVFETRAGTYAAVELEDGSYTYQALPPMAPLLPPGLAPGDDEFSSDAAPAEPLRTYNANGTPKAFVPMRDPVLEEKRRACLRLLRAAMVVVGPNSNRLPGHRELGMAADTHDYAKKLLAPYLTPAPKGRPRKGEESGARLVGQFVTLHQLYCAVGNRQVKLGEGGPAPDVRTKAAPAPDVDRSGPVIMRDHATGRPVIVGAAIADELAMLRRARELGLSMSDLPVMVDRE